MKKERNEYLKHLKDKGYKIINDNQVQNNGYIFNIVEDMRDTSFNTISTYYLKLAN